jgi:hypothetical protein
VGVCVEGIQECVLSGEFGTWGECVGDVTPSDTPTGSCECTPEIAAPDGGYGAIPDNTAKLCDGVHTECDCGKSGGQVVDIGQACKLCRFDEPACPDGWTNYQDWRTTIDGTDCGGVVQLSPTGRGGAEEDCPPFVPAVQASDGIYMLSCDRQADYCCGTPPNAASLVAYGKPWSSHVPDTKTFNQGYNPCGCACGPETCTTKLLSCIAPTVQIGCV